ncbi:MAG: hypothetical protein ABSD58_14705 [Verrucomicrobiia bacterium]|jgi:hypothetical protein
MEDVPKPSTGEPRGSMGNPQGVSKEIPPATPAVQSGSPKKHTPDTNTLIPPEITATLPNYPRWLPQLPRVIYLCLVEQNFKPLNFWFWEEVADLRKGWEIFTLIALLLVWRTWVWCSQVADHRVESVKQEGAATNSVLIATNAFLTGQITAMTNENNRLHAEIEKNKQDAKQEAESQETKLQTQYNAKLQEKDAEVNRLTTEKASLQTRNDFWTAQSAVILDACSNLINSSSTTAANRQEIDLLVGQVQTAVKLAEANTSLLATIGSTAPQFQVVIDGVALPMNQPLSNMTMPLTNETQTVSIVVRNMGNQSADRVNVALVFSTAYTNSIEVPESWHGWSSEPYMKEENGREVPDLNTKHYSVTSDMPIAAGGAGFGCTSITFKNPIDKPHDYTIEIMAVSGGARPCQVQCGLHFRPGVKESKLE